MIRLDARSIHLRSLIIDALEGGGCGHIGASMSLVEILRVLYDDVMKHHPLDPHWRDRDRCILSKGHGCLALYAILADHGYFEYERLWEFCRPGALLGGHPERGVPGVEASTGALGHGLGLGVGMALAARAQGRGSRIFVVLGDGEIQEGSVWEAAGCASKHRLGSLTAIVDYNGIQSAGYLGKIQPIEPLAAKWRSFGWKAVECQGHAVTDLKAFFRAQHADPTAYLCHTVKGRGISFAEGRPEWHHRSMIGPDLIAQLRAALREQEAAIA
jgi:transketolase